MKDALYFTWIKSNGQFHPQKRLGLPINSANGKPYNNLDIVVFNRLLDDSERELSLDQLCQKYPYEKEIPDETFKLSAD